MSTKDRVLAVVAEVFGVETHNLTDRTSFANDLGGDSLYSAELLFRLEDGLGCTFDMADVPPDMTLGDIVRIAEGLVGT